MLFKFLQDILYRKSGKLLTSYDDEVEFVPFLIQRWLSMHSKNTVKILNDTTNQLYSVFETKDQWYKMFLCLIPKTYFKKRILTHRYGIKHAKPSTYCFSLIKKMEKCNWSQMVYIGDDPNKDFVNLNPLGVKTVRTHTGRFKDHKAKSGYDAVCHINNLAELQTVLRK